MDTSDFITKTLHLKIHKVKEVTPEQHESLAFVKVEPSCSSVPLSESHDNLDMAELLRFAPISSGLTQSPNHLYLMW